MSSSFANQVLAQIELWTNRAKYDNKVYTLPKLLDEHVARLHLGKLGAQLTELTPEQAAYIRRRTDRPVQAGALPLLSAIAAAPVGRRRYFEQARRRRRARGADSLLARGATQTAYSVTPQAPGAGYRVHQRAHAPSASLLHDIGTGNPAHGACAPTDL